MTLLAGNKFAGYDIVAELGRGGMGAVYKARQPLLDRFVALKVMSPQLGGDPNFVARFIREAASAAKLNHPNMVQIHTAGEQDGTYFIVMEFVEGRSLHDHIAARGRIEPDEAVAITVYVAQALEHAWNKAQLVHRDIKPANIFLSNAGEVKVGDLGLAKSLSAEVTEVTASGIVLGSPHWMAPEQAQGVKDIDFRADIYSLGCTLYQMLSGRTPYDADQTLALVLKHLNEPVPDLRTMAPSCPAPLAALVAKMMAKNRDERYPSYEALLGDLLAIHDGFQSSAATPLPTVTAPASAAALPQRNSKWFAGTGAGVALLAGLLFWAPWKQHATVAPATPAPPAAADAGLVLHLDFTKPPEGGIVHDLSGHGNDGRVEGATWVAEGRHGGAMSFDNQGKSQQVRVPNSESLNPRQITIAAWIKSPPPTPPDDGHWNRIADKDWAHGYNLSFGGHLPRANLTGQIQFEINRGNRINSNLRVADDAWHHLAVAYDGGQPQMYVDGQRCGFTLGAWQSDIHSTPCDLIIGNKQPEGTDADGFNGLLEVVRIYNRALGADEIAVLAGTASSNSAMATAKTVPAGSPKGSLMGPPLWAATLQEARQIPAPQWPDWKPHALGRIRHNVEGWTSDTAAVDRTLAAISQVFDDARAKSDAEFESGKQALLDRWGQALRSIGGGPRPQER